MPWIPFPSPFSPFFLCLSGSDDSRAALQDKIVHRTEAVSPQGESPGTNIVFGVHSVFNHPQTSKDAHHFH